MCEQTLPGQAQVFLTAAMHDVGIRCVDLGHVPLQLHFTCCGAALFLSFEVRACCNSAVDFTGKKVVSVDAMFKIEVAIDFYVTKQRISTSSGVCRLLGCSRRAPSTAVRLPTVASSRGNKLSIRSCRSNSVSLHFTQTFLEKVLVVFNHAMLKSFVQRKKQSPHPSPLLPTACRIVKRSMDR